MISVIIPVYKVEKCLPICINSVLKQTYTNYEIILIDDGSPDKSPEICDYYAKKYHNIKVVHKSNGGVADARNCGLINAKGKYITFIDSDDYVDKHYLNTLYNNLKNFKSDISVVDRKKVFDNKNRFKANNNKKDYCISGEEALKKVLYQKNMDTNVWGILLPRELALQFPFPTGKYHEDDFVTYQYYLSAKKVAVSTAKLYYYVQRRNSIMHKLGKTCLDELDAADNIEIEIRKYRPSLSKAALSKKFSNYCQVLLSDPNLKEKNKSLYNRIILFLEKAKIKIIIDPNVRLKNKAAALILLFGDNTLTKINQIKIFIMKQHLFK